MVKRAGRGEAVKRGSGRRAGSPGFLGRWLKEGRGSRAAARPGLAEGVGSAEEIQSRGNQVCWGRGSRQHPPLPNPSPTPTAWKVAKDAGRG